jgi:hypothetical protein
MKQEKHLIQCLFCEKYLGWYVNKPKKRTLAICDGICLENLTKHLDQELNKRAEAKVKSWKKINQKDEEELIIFTGKQYQDLVNNAQALEKGQNIRNSAKNISQLLMGVRK